MSFAAPLLLVALVVLPLAVVAYVALDRGRVRRSARWSRTALIPNMVTGGTPGRRRYVAAAMFLVAVAFLLVGFARPQRVRATGNGVVPSIVVAVDVSGSMAATDVRPTRVLAARAIATRLIRELPSRDQVAVVTFGNNAHVVVPPTSDHAAAIAGLPKAVAPRAGTAIGDAIKDAVAVIAQSGAEVGQGRRPGSILLLTDGTQTAGGATPLDAALYARADGIAIDTVAIGEPGATVTVKEEGVPTRVAVPVDHAMLDQISTETGGTAIADPSASGLRAVYAGLGAAPSASHRHEQELSALTAAAALLLTVGGVFVSARWFGQVA
jgi:Ca-activated chloride channel homolog